MKHLKTNYPRIRRVFFTVLTLFLLVFLLRGGYELMFLTRDTAISAPHVGMGFESRPYHIRFQNIATDIISQRGIAGDIITIDQKYEKTANITSVSQRFDEDHSQLRDLINTHDAMVQTEIMQGLPGNQTLTMTIGVIPQQFDEMVNSLRELGTLRSFTVNRVDKTNEFNSLLAQQEVLRKTRESYASLQEMGGNLQDMLLLQERILRVETELQHLSVDLGIFATEHSFCTINFTLREQEASAVSLQLVLRSARYSFWWTLGAAGITAFVVLGLLGAAVLGLWLRIKLGNMQAAAPHDDAK